MTNPTSTPDRPRRRILTIVTALGLLVLLSTATLAWALVGRGQAPTAAAVRHLDRPAPTPAPPVPTTDDIELSIKTLEKQCYGTAGCNITFRIELAYLLDDYPDAETTYEVTYEVAGGESTHINTLTVTGDEYKTTEREHLETASDDAELEATVLDVSEY